MTPKPTDAAALSTSRTVGAKVNESCRDVPLKTKTP
jgi:hypothetical protein